MSWPLVKLKDCCSVVGGATPKRNVESYWNSPDVPWITPKDVSKLETPVLEDAPEYISHAGYKSCATYMLPKGSILLTSRAPIGNVAIAGREMCTNQGFKSLVPGKDVDSSYLFYCMLAHSKNLDALGNGATFKEVSKKVVENFEIPLPPLKKQQRIAAILDKADAIRRKRQQAIALADEFLRSVFLEMFGDPITNSKGWKVVELGELIEKGDKLNYGVVQPGEHAPNGIPIIRSGDLSDSTPDIDGLRRVSFSIDHKHRKSKLKGNEILIACVGSIGNVGWVTEEMIGWNIARAVTRIPLKSSVNREYVYRYIQSPVVQGYFHKETRAVAQPTLNVGLISKTPIALPPLKLQEEFLIRHSKVAKFKSKLTDQLQTSKKIFDSLSQNAFSGRL